MNTENSKTNEPQKFRLTLANKRNLNSPNKNLTLSNLSIYCTLINNKSTYNNCKFKISAPTWNLSCLMDHTLFQTFKIILSTLLKNMKL